MAAGAEDTILRALLHHKDVITAEHVVEYKGNCAINMTAVYTLVSPYLGRALGKAPQQATVTCTLKRALKPTPCKSDRKKLGAGGSCGSLNYLVLDIANSNLTTAKQLVESVLSRVHEGGGLEAEEAYRVAYDAAREAHKASDEAQAARERLQEVEEAWACDKEKINTLTAELQEFKDKELRKQHITYLREQQTKQAAGLAEHGASREYLESVHKEHHTQLWQNGKYREEWDYQIYGWAPSGRRLHFKWGAQARWDTTHTWEDGDLVLLPGLPVIWREKSCVKQGPTDSKVAVYCGKCGLLFNMPGITVRLHRSVCSGQFGMAP